MKTLLFYLAFLMVSFSLYGQDESKNQMVDIDEIVVSPPRFTGTINSISMFNTDNMSLIKKHLYENVECPDRALQSGLEGTEVISFVVTPEGNLTDFEIVNSVCREIDKEVIDVLKRTNGMWLPGFNNGKPISMEQEISMAFGNSNTNSIVKHFKEMATKYYCKANDELLTEHRPQKALKFYNKGIVYLPNDKSLLLLRGICNYELGDAESARRDWDRIIELGGIDPYPYELSETKGYSEMMEMLAKNQDR
ncbi:energy transducer TonB [Prolixibacteraceae bacterium Z1-6]|uniref:Energy transducer TonB n=1 Tax=Draconibacterium aestuarii TaxID=2998507 RepID=A0A9X3F9Y5_9BACT|nr:energy transducer TonB [Prolixibacteraceae bacterium Z1-6]